MKRRRVSLFTFSILPFLLLMTSCANHDRAIIIDISYNHAYADLINDALRAKGAKPYRLVDAFDRERYNQEILLDNLRPESLGVLNNMPEDADYAIKSNNHQLITASKDWLTRYYVADLIAQKYITEDGVAIPDNLDISGKRPSNKELYHNIYLYHEDILEETLQRATYPFIFNGSDYYYLFCSGKTESGDDVIRLYYSSDMNTWTAYNENLISISEEMQDELWSPQVYKRNNKYYMVMSYNKNKSTDDIPDKRGVAILRSNTINSGYETISYYGDSTNLGFITPNEGCAINGSLYFDKNDKPYLLYIKEWTDTPDKTSRVMVTSLSDDLTHMIDEPKCLFSAKDVLFSTDDVVDSPFVYQLSDGRFIMLISGYLERDGYATGFATSDSLYGPWEQHERVLFGSHMVRNGLNYDYGEHDGGHGTLFKGKDNKLYMCLNTPANVVTEMQIYDVWPHPVVFPMREAFGGITIDLYHPDK